MKLAIMQPYLFPYIGYWQLINAADTFVVYDNIQFSKKGWFHRNNILINGEKKLFTIPLKKDSDYLDVVNRYLADDAGKQIKKIVAQIENSYRKAPYFNEVFPLISELFCYQEKNLFKYILNSINEICSYLSIDTKIIISSEVAIDHNLKAQDKVIAISKRLDALEYTNSIGGMSLYDADKFKTFGIQLDFLATEFIEYAQFDRQFEPSMSIIDIMMFNNTEQIKLMLNNYKFIKKRHEIV